MSETNHSLIKLIDKLAMNTWPAETQAPLEGWQLRASGGISKRANSVWTSTGTMPSDENWLSSAKDFYRNHELPLRFHISDATPDDLNRLLDDWGYTKEVPCTVMVAETQTVLRNTRNIQPLCTIQILPEPDDEWLNHFIAMEEHETWKKPFYERLFHAIAPLKGFMTLYLNGEPVAVGTAVIEQGWAGFINIAVNPAHRSKGLGKELVHHLAQWSFEQKANRLYLQVIDDNEPAIRLYTKAGYTPLFGYHYRCEKERR